LYVFEEPATWSLEKVLGTRDQIRIKNQATGEYLYAAADDLAQDSERRRVFTWTDTSTSPTSDTQDWEKKADWKVEEENDCVKLKNIRYGEFLYAAADERAFDESSRSVFTWKDEDTLGQEGLWKFSTNIKGNLGRF
jgi:hypothetical protein